MCVPNLRATGAPGGRRSQARPRGPLEEMDLGRLWHAGTAGSGPCLHLPVFHFGYRFFEPQPRWDLKDEGHLEPSTPKKPLGCCTRGFG